MISSELPEVLGMSDRVLVMREGRIVAEFERAHATPEAVGAAMMGEAARAGTGRVSARRSAALAARVPAVCAASPRRRRCWRSP